MKQMKGAHEHRFARPDRARRERLARTSRIALASAGVVAGISIGGIVRQFKDAFEAIIGSQAEGEAKPKTFWGALKQILRFAPLLMVFVVRDLNQVPIARQE